MKEVAIVDDKQVETFRLQLLQLQEQLLALKATGDDAARVVELDQTSVGRLSRMDALQAQAMSQETGRRRRQHLVEIDAALTRIESGEYGDCFECGELIHPGRLSADPAVRLCISCAEALE